MDRNITLRPVEERDFSFILRINEENVAVLSAMDEAKLRKFAETATPLLVAEVDGELAGFIVVLREGLEYYKSLNYLWFSERYEKFLYIDRIVIDEPFRHMGLGKAIYKAVFEEAKKQGVDYVLAEIDTIPYNEISLGFHKLMGFVQVGEQDVPTNNTRVSLQEAKVN